MHAYWNLALAFVLTTPVITLAQATATAPPPPAKAYRFDVISIRENKTPLVALGNTLPFGPTADGYRMTNSSLGNALLMTAYVQVGPGKRDSGLVDEQALRHRRAHCRRG